MFNTLLKTDFYKCCHMLQYDNSVTHFTSYLTPRNSRFKTIDKMVFFGLSNFIQKYLVEDFNTTSVLFEQLMGTGVTARKAYIKEHSQEATYNAE